jgi:hypothetical protein
VPGRPSLVQVQRAVRVPPVRDDLDAQFRGPVAEARKVANLIFPCGRVAFPVTFRPARGEPGGRPRWNTAQAGSGA